MKRFLAILLTATTLLSMDSVAVLATETNEATEVVETTSAVDVPETSEVMETSETTEIIEEIEDVKVEEISVMNEEENITNPPSGYLELPRESETPAYRYDVNDAVPFYQSALESKYVTENLPTIRSQGNYGTCWAFSSVALAELDLLQSGVETDLSELQLAYFTYNSATEKDPLGGTAGDRNWMDTTQGNFAQVGGNLIFASRALANWVGYVDESVAPYENIGDAVNNGLNTDLAYGSNTVHLKNAYYINIKENPEIAKSMIKECGGIGISYYADEYDVGYNETNNCYYLGMYSGSNHAVTVVGWDDNFSKDNFNADYQPSSDGAWLVRNSWGSYDDENNIYGYFWMSYEETSISDTAYAFDVTIAGEDDYYDNNYQYDGTIFSSSIYFAYQNTFTAANIFSTKSGADNEILKAISFETSGANQKYAVNIYKDLTNTNNPESGTLVASQSGNCDLAGIYTVELDNAISLTEGTTFSVVVTITSNIEGGTAQINAEYFYPWDEEGTQTKGVVNVDPCAEAGQSFYKSGNNWYDYGASEQENFCIKAYTDDASTVAVTGVTIENSDVEIGVGEELQLVAKIEPSTASNLNLTWESSDESVATVNELGKVTGVSHGETTITVTTADKGFTDEAHVQVTNKLVSISLSEEELEIILHETATVDVTYNPEDTSSDKTVTWSSSAPTIASVDSNGVITAKSYGYCVITATAAGKEAQCTVYVVPPAPDLEALVLADGTTQLTITESEGCNSYYIFRYDVADDESDDESERLDILTEAGTYIDATAEAGRRYLYFVRSQYYDGSYIAYNYSEYIPPSYQIFYELGGGINAVNNPTTFNWDEETFSLEDPTHDTAIFEGWYYDSAYKNKVGTINPYNTLKNITVYAKWRQRQAVQLDWLVYSPIQDYTGNTFEPTISVVKDEVALVEGRDYTAIYTNTTENGNNVCQVTVTGIGEYIGTQTVTITERKATLQNGMVSEMPDMIYNGSVLEPNPTVTFNGVILEKDVDYTVSYSNNTDIGNAVVTITGTGHFEGEVTRRFLIRSKSLEEGFVATISEQEYTGEAIEPVVVLTYNGVTLQENIDYRVTYRKNTEVGTATATIKGRGNYGGTIRVNFEIVGADLRSLASNNQLEVLLGGEADFTTVHTGTSIEPEVTVVLSNGKVLSEGTDYTVSYENNIQPGTAKVTIAGMGNYIGSIEKTFEIRKHDIGNASVVAGKKVTVLYAPNGQSPVPKVEYEGKRLVAGTDFTTSYYPIDESGTRTGSEQTSVTAVGQYELVIKGIGKFNGEIAKASIVAVKARSLSGEKVVVENPYARVDGENVTAKYQLWCRGNLLQEGIDYTSDKYISEDGSYVTYAFTGIGNYTGTLTQRFVAIDVDMIVFSEGEYKIATISEQSYTGKRICPELQVINDAGESLQEGIDYTVTYKHNLNIGTATATVTGIGNCVGTMTQSFAIVPMDAASIEVELSNQTLEYTGDSVNPEITVSADRVLVENVDYTVVYVDNSSVATDSVDTGDYKAIITFVGNYTGTKEIAYSIQPVSVGKLGIQISAYTYTGNAIVPSVENMQIYLNGELLSEEQKAGLSVTLAESNVDVTNSALATISGTGNFTGSTRVGFEIIGKELDSSDLNFVVAGNTISSSNTGYKAEWTGTEIEPSVEIWDGSEQLVLGEDYSVVYRYNTEIGRARIVISGKNNYQGTKTLFFDIVGMTLSEAEGYTVSLEDTNYIYDGTKKQPKVEVVKDAVLLEEGIDYSVTYSNNVNAGTAKVLVSGIGKYTGSITKEFTIAPKTREDATSVKTSTISKQRYTGELITPDITIEIDGVKLVKGTDFSVVTLNGVEVGTATLLATGIGNYSGLLAEQQFEIYMTTITYVMNGGVNNAANPTTYTATDSFTLAAPTKDAYNFAGWYSNKACTKKVTGVKVGTNGDLTFYAKWTPKQVYGIDVSKWQNQANSSGTIDWSAVKNAGKSFAMIRLSYGQTKDPYFEYNYSGARNAGVKTGVYCYNTATTVSAAVEQANYVIGQLNGRPLDYPVCLDMEGNTVGALDNTTRTNIVYAFKNVVERAGYDFILYANKNWLDNYFDNPRLAGMDLWIARYCDYSLGHRYTGAGNVRMWQYTSSGTVNGITGLVDLNVCYEDYVGHF